MWLNAAQFNVHSKKWANLIGAPCLSRDARSCTIYTRISSLIFLAAASYFSHINGALFPQHFHSAGSGHTLNLLRTMLQKKKAIHADSWFVSRRLSFVRARCAWSCGTVQPHDSFFLPSLAKCQPHFQVPLLPISYPGNEVDKMQQRLGTILLLRMMPALWRQGAIQTWHPGARLFYKNTHRKTWLSKYGFHGSSDSLFDVDVCFIQYLNLCCGVQSWMLTVWYCAVGFLFQLPFSNHPAGKKEKILTTPAPFRLIAGANIKLF